MMLEPGLRTAEPARILVVDDERIVAKDIQQTLADLGYDAFAIAASAEEALARASDQCPDLVLMDIRINGQLDGIQTAEILRERFDVPVVYLTAYSDEETIDRAKKTEPHGYLLKPVKPAELRSAVELSLYKHEMELRLRHRERWFSTTLRSIADAVISVDLAGRITFMNPAAERLTGSSFEAARGRQVRDVLRLVDDSARRVMGTPLEQALESGQPIELREARILGVPEGEPRLISDSAAPVRDRDETLGAVMVFRDVTEQRQSEKQLEVADRLTSLSSMAAGVAREINNPLTVITTNAEYVLGEVHDFRGVFETGLPENGSAELLERADAVLDALREAQAAAGRIIRLVSDLHTFSRVPRAEVALCDVGRIIHTAVRETQQQCRGRARLTMHIENVPPVRANEHRLAQVIVRLLLNAVHTAGAEASDSHDVQITLRVEQRGRVVIEVRDNGPGFSADLRDRIFEPFSVENVTDTGLSLAICHGIIQSFGGQIEVDSQVGKGTLFRILLPRAGSLAPSAATESATAELRALGGKRKILVIDDEQLVLRAVRRVLGQHYEVVITDAARQAVQLVLDGQRFDLILCDLMMPDMSGMEFYEWLVSIRPEEASRVVFLTGGAVSARADEFLRGVSNPRVEKPFDVTRLKELVRLLLPS